MAQRTKARMRVSWFGPREKIPTALSPSARTAWGKSGVYLHAHGAGELAAMPVTASEDGRSREKTVPMGPWGWPLGRAERLALPPRGLSGGDPAQGSAQVGLRCPSSVGT